jgi:hypothetical protein
MSEYSQRIGGYKSIYERLAVAETQSSVAKRVSNSPLHENKSIDGGTSSRSYFNFRSSSPSPSQRSIQPSLSSSSRMVVSPKIFDRLASTETYASAKLKGKIKDDKRSSSTPRKTSMAFFARLAYTETFASAQMKGLIDAAAKKEPRSSSRARSVRSTQSEARGESFWDRMSKTETYASMTLKGKLSPTSKQHQQQQQQSFYVDPRASLRHYGGSSSSVRSAVSPSARSISSRSSSRKGPVPSSFFDRLSKAQTISSMQKTRNLQGNQQGQRSKTPDAARMFHNSNRSVYSSDARLPPSASKARKSLYNGGSNASVASSQQSPRSVRTTSPSTRSVGTARTTKSVATTRSVTTSKSLGNSTIDTLYTMSSAYSTSYRKTSRQSASLAPKKSSTSSSSSHVATVAQPRRLPPPSPKTTRLGASGKPLTRDQSSSPRALSMRQRTSTFTTSSYARTAAATKAAAAAAAAVKSAPKPTPPPRPVLKFDDDDDELSFGSEGSDEASLGPSSVSKAPQDAGSVASKSMASKKSTSSAIAELTATTEAEMASVGLKESPTEDSYALHDGDEGGRDREMSFAQSVSNDGEESVGHQIDEKSADTCEQQGEENIDEYLDSIEKQSADEYDDEVDKDNVSPDSREMEETMEPKPKSNPRIAVVHESDDELSFGSDEGEDEWMNGHENGKDGSVASKDASHDAEEIAVDDDDEHDAEESNKDDHDFKSKQIVDPIDNIESHDYKEGPSESMEEEEERSYMSDAHSTKTPEAIDEISMTDQHDDGSQGSFAEEDQGIKGDDEEESVSYGNSVNVEEEEKEEIVEEDSVADHVEYDNEDCLDYGESDREDEYQVDAQHIEEEYDEEDDLEQMDSLDLILDATKSKDSKHEHEEHIVDEEEEFDDKIVHGAQELQCKYKIFKTEKYHPEYGEQEVNPDDLYLKETLECFERGEISNEEIAVLIIEALFELDFSHGEHWEIDDGTARELEEDEGGGGDLKGRAFAVKRQARLDWNDLYSVAASKGTVVVVPEKNEIRVENYSYFVAG